MAKGAAPPQSTDLGDLIDRLSPYINGRWVGKGGPNTGDMDIYTLNPSPAQGGAPNGTPSQIQLEVDAAYAGEWTFKGQSHRLGKAARVLYRFPVLDSTGAELYWVEDYILIGFEDGGV